MQMYNDEIMRIPKDEAEMWQLLENQFEFVCDILTNTPVEFKDDALENKFHLKKSGGVSRSSMSVIRYKNIGEELDQRGYFLAMGRELIPLVKAGLLARKITPEFVQQWGKVMFCHGYIASHIFDDSDDLIAHRNRIKGALVSQRTTQHIFIARLVLWFMDEGKQPRQRAEANAAKSVWNFINMNDEEYLSPDYDIKWFKALVRDRNERDEIIATMSQKYCSEANLRKIASTKMDGLPDILHLLVGISH